MSSSITATKYGNFAVLRMLISSSRVKVARSSSVIFFFTTELIASMYASPDKVLDVVSEPPMVRSVALL